MAAKLTAEETEGKKRPVKGLVAERVTAKMREMYPNFKKKPKTVQQWGRQPKA
jgi:hypothetical protein